MDETKKFIKRLDLKQKLDTHYKYQIAEIIHNTNLLDYALSEIIEFSFIEPNSENAEIFKAMILNSTTLTLGNKIKIFRFLNNKKKWITDDEILQNLGRISNIRNLFAHTPLRTINILLGESHNDFIELPDIKFEGIIKTYTRNELYEEFFNIFKKTFIEFTKIANKLELSYHNKQD